MESDSDSSFDSKIHLEKRNNNLFESTDSDIDSNEIQIRDLNLYSRSVENSRSGVLCSIQVANIELNSTGNRQCKCLII